MKKKILFVIPDFAHGGTNKTLENYLPLLTAYDVFIFCHTGSKREGYYFDLFRPYLIPLFLLNYIVKVNFITRKLFTILFRCLPNIKDTIDRKEIEYIQRKHKFDVVIAFQEGDTTRYVSKLLGVNKIVWLHSFYKPLEQKSRHQEFWSLYRSFNHVVCVSEELKKCFIQFYPSLAKQTVQIYNPINSEKVKELSSDIIGEPLAVYDGFNGFKILSIGRLDKVKNFHLIPDIISKIKGEKEHMFRWYVIGSAFDDAYKQELMKQIHIHHVEDELVILGQKDNPYPYIKQADLVACTSDSESFSYVINEAKILHTPIISNNFPVAKEVLPSDCGWISSLEDMPDMLYHIINDVDGVYSKVQKTISGYSYPNEHIVEKIKQILK